MPNNFATEGFTHLSPYTKLYPKLQSGAWLALGGGRKNLWGIIVQKLMQPVVHK